MKKVFIVAGELSGDSIGAWYLKKLQQKHDGLVVQAVGGSFLQGAGTDLYAHFSKFSCVGVVEIIKHLPFLIKAFLRLGSHILNNDFDTVVLVDFPGFNLRLAKWLKKRKPSLNIIYVSPPQLWVWGAWRIKTLQKYCNAVVVMYPFEVAWYKERGVIAVWEGSPAYDRVAPFFDLEQARLPVIALMPGSRLSEVITLAPLFAQIISRFATEHPEVRFALCRAASISRSVFEDLCLGVGFTFGESVFIVEPEETFAVVSRCCAALIKPGTCSLEVALLGVPAIVVYKVSWITYYLARLVVHVPYMALPNLFLKTEVYKERIQGECSPKLVYNDLHAIYEGFTTKSDFYKKQSLQLSLLRQAFYFT